MRNLTLEQFLSGPSRNEHVNYTSTNGRRLESYLRKPSIRLVFSEYYENVLDRAATYVKKEGGMVRMVGSGAYREFDAKMRKLAHEHGFDGIYVEQVFNEYLPAVLTRYGYEQAGPIAWWLPLGDRAKKNKGRRIETIRRLEEFAIENRLRIQTSTRGTDQQMLHSVVLRSEGGEGVTGMGAAESQSPWSITEQDARLSMAKGIEGRTVTMGWEEQRTVTVPELTVEEADRTQIPEKAA